MCLCMHDFQETIFNAVPNSNLSNSSLSLIFELHTRCTEREGGGGDRYCFLFKYITMFAVYLYDIIL